MAIGKFQEVVSGREQGLSPSGAQGEEGTIDFEKKRSQNFAPLAAVPLSAAGGTTAAVGAGTAAGTAAAGGGFGLASAPQLMGGLAAANQGGSGSPAPAGGGGGGEVAGNIAASSIDPLQKVGFGILNAAAQRRAAARARAAQQEQQGLAMQSRGIENLTQGQSSALRNLVGIFGKALRT